MAIFELSSKKNKNGRRQFSASLYKLQPPECVVNGIGTQYNENGITFLEKYAQETLDSIKGMSVTASFLDEERTEICDHGFTQITQDGLATFDEASIIGFFDEGYIDTIDINGVPTRCVCGRGTLDEMRYHAFIEKLEQDLASGYSIEGSIEIFKDENHDTIVYENGYHEKGRIPMYYIHSGWSFVLNPADSNSLLLELNAKNQNKEEQNNMDEKMLQGFVSEIKQVISETNSKNEELSKTITELNEVIANKDTTIAELNASSEELKTALEKAQEDYQEIWKKEGELYNEIKELKKQLAEAQAKERVGEMNSAIADFSDEEKEYAKAEIDAFTADPINCEINSVVNKIWEGIGKKAKEDAKVIAEQNASNNIEVEDIFAEVSEINSAEDDESIF